jgi:hypothetical protein
MCSVIHYKYTTANLHCKLKVELLIYNISNSTPSWIDEWRRQNGDGRQQNGDGRPETAERRRENGDGRTETAERRQVLPSA